MKHKLWIILVIFIVVLLAWSRIERANASDNIDLLRLEIGKKVEQIHTVNLFHYNDKSLTLVFFSCCNKHYLILHKYSKFKNDKLIFFLPHYKVVRVIRKELFRSGHKYDYYKAVE